MFSESSKSLKAGFILKNSYGMRKDFNPGSVFYFLF